MNYSQIIKNKFVIALPVGLLLLGCLYKFNQYKLLDTKKTDEEKQKQKEEYNLIYYVKCFLVCYIIALVLIVLLKKGYNYYNEHIKSKSSQIITTQNNKLNIIDNKPNTEESNSLSNTNETTTTMITPTTNTILTSNNPLNKLEELDLSLDTDTSNLEEITLPKVDKESEKLNKKKILLAKRKKLLELKRRRDKETKEKNENNLALEVFNTGTPNF